MNRVFQFKDFSLSDSNSAMKIGMDAIILGAYCSRENFEKTLDIGTGCGIIAVMIAQKSRGEILAIDIDKPSINEAADNFRKSPWKDRLEAKHISVQEFASDSQLRFDRIVCNPPYFNKSLLSEEERKNNSRHNLTLSYEDLVEVVVKLLKTNARFDCIFPVEISNDFDKLMFAKGLYLIEELLISTFDNTKQIRRITSYSRIKSKQKITDKISIRTDNKNYTKAYWEFTKDYFLNLPYI